MHRTADPLQQVVVDPASDTRACNTQRSKREAPVTKRIGQYDEEDEQTMTAQQGTQAEDAVRLGGSTDRSAGSLIQQVVDTGSQLIAAEVQLAKQEISDSVRAGVTALLGGVVAIFGAVAFFVMAIVTVVTAVSLHWAAALGFAVLFLVVAILGALLSVQRMKRISPLRQTTETFKEDVAWAKRQLTRDAK